MVGDTIGRSGGQEVMMSRSRRRTPIIGKACAPSDKPAKVSGHRQARAALRSALVYDAEAPHRLEYGDPCIAPKDGKHWFGDRHPRLMRK